jgi:hypothetical protein
MTNDSNSKFLIESGNTVHLNSLFKFQNSHQTHKHTPLRHKLVETYKIIIPTKSYKQKNQHKNVNHKQNQYCKKMGPVIWQEQNSFELGKQMELEQYYTNCTSLVTLIYVCCHDKHYLSINSNHSCLHDVNVRSYTKQSALRP